MHIGNALSSVTHKLYKRFERHLKQFKMRHAIKPRLHLDAFTFRYSDGCSLEICLLADAMRSTLLRPKAASLPMALMGWVYWDAVLFTSVTIVRLKVPLCNIKFDIHFPKDTTVARFVNRLNDFYHSKPTAAEVNMASVVQGEPKTYADLMNGLVTMKGLRRRRSSHSGDGVYVLLLFY